MATALLVLAAAIGSARPAGAAPAPRFFFSGDGVLDLDNAHSAERLHVRYRDAEGRYDPDALAAIARFFRSRTDGRSGPVTLRLVELIDFVQDRYRPPRLTLVSGYRSPEFNAALRGNGRRVAEASLHTEGLAADLQPAGVDLRRLWLDLRALEVGGVGLYQAEGFIHLDTGRPRFWEPATSGIEKHLSAGNARIFARTEFDRYADLHGAAITLHGVTALPIRIERRASIGDRELVLTPTDGATAAAGDCYLIDEPAGVYGFTVDTSAAPPGGRIPIRLRTCAPRSGATPAEIDTNPIERVAAVP